MSMQPGFQSVGSFMPDNLFAGHFPAISEMVLLTGAAALPRGAVLGRITVTGRYVLSAAAAVDGSEIPDAVLLDAADATDGDVAVPVLLTGEVNGAALTLGVGHTLDGIRHLLRLRGLFIRANVGA